MQNIDQFIENLPKAELHLHIEGSIEPELIFKIAERNKIKLNYGSVDELSAAYSFNNLQEFLDVYYEGANVLKTEEDFYELTISYFKKIHSENVIHAELMFDPQTHTTRGINFSTIINGIKSGQEKAEEKFGISSRLIMNFLRHLSEESAFKTLQNAEEYRSIISAVGLDSSELGYPPSKFKNVFKKAREEGYIVTAHAGEEAPAEYIWDALNNLKVTRIDHGIRSIDDESLVNRLIDTQIPLTVCPLSNVKLKNVDKIENHPLKTMFDKGLIVTINSDDPAYFGGYMNENYKAVSKALNLTKDDLYVCTLNSFNSTFLEKYEKDEMIKKLDKYYQHNK